MASGVQHERSPVFHASIEKLFLNWSALQIALENGQGGQYGKDIAVWMRGAVEDFFYQNDDLMGEEVADFLSEIMNTELDTIVEDNSVEDLGNQLCKHFRLIMDNKLDEVHKLQMELDAAALKPQPQSQVLVPEVDDSESDSESSTEEMETDEITPSTSNNTVDPPSQNLRRSGNNTYTTEPDDEGWSTVVKSRRR